MPRVNPDQNDIVVWLLNESAVPFVNSSVSTQSLGAAANLTIMNGTVETGQLSVFGQSCPYWPAFGNFPSGASSTYNRLETAGGVAQDVPLPMTVSGWVKVRSYVNLGDNFGFILMKRYQNNQTWNSPFTTMDFTMWNSADGTWRADVTMTGGSFQQLLMSPTDYPMPVGRWSHIGWTCDGAVLKAYLNGVLAGQLSLNPGGTIDNSGHGAWAFGATANGDGNKQEGAFSACDFRIANVIRPQAYFENIYRQGVLAF